MITPSGTCPEDCDRRPEYPLRPLLTLTVQEHADGSYLATAWAVGTDCRRCTREWAADRWIVTGYPEVWDRGLRLLLQAVEQEMTDAGIWHPVLEPFRENAVHSPHAGPPPAETA